MGRLLAITLHISRVGSLPISSNNKVCLVGTLLLFCFKYRVGRLPFFQLEKNITLTTYLHMARTFLLLNSFTSIIYGEVLQNSIETKMAEYEVFA